MFRSYIIQASAAVTLAAPATRFLKERKIFKRIYNLLKAKHLLKAQKPRAVIARRSPDAAIANTSDASKLIQKV
ncbi:MAG: hypothetical protein V4642_11875 [Bacteroidota bacterium]